MFSQIYPKFTEDSNNLITNFSSIGKKYLFYFQSENNCHPLIKSKSTFFKLMSYERSFEEDSDYMNKSPIEDIKIVEIYTCENTNQHRELNILSYEHSIIKGIFTITIPKENEINITYFFKVGNVIKYYTFVTYTSEVFLSINKLQTNISMYEKIDMQPNSLYDIGINYLAKHINHSFLLPSIVNKKLKTLNEIYDFLNLISQM